MMSKLTIVKTFVVQTLHRTITHSVIIIRKTTKKIEIMKTWGGGVIREILRWGIGKRAFFYLETFI